MCSNAGATSHGIVRAHGALNRGFGAKLTVLTYRANSGLSHSSLITVEAGWAVDTSALIV